jgi:hypothetical protein
LGPEKTIKNSKLPKLPENCFEPVGKGGWPLISTWIITTSRIPYASPVVLVQKKDGSFTLCIDYRGLNKMIIKNKFPIPFIDKMLDEIHGEKILLKIRYDIKVHSYPSKNRRCGEYRFPN